MRKDAPVKSIEEARRTDLPPLILGGSADGGIGNDVPIILHDTIGLHLKQVVGYPDSPAIFAAIERGEVHGRTVDLSTLRSVQPDWLKPDGAFRILVQFGRATRHPQLPDVPTARELARNEAARSLIELAELPLFDFASRCGPAGHSGPAREGFDACVPRTSRAMRNIWKMPRPAARRKPD